MGDVLYFGTLHKSGAFKAPGFCSLAEILGVRFIVEADARRNRRLCAFGGGGAYDYDCIGLLSADVWRNRRLRAFRKEDFRCFYDALGWSCSR